MRGVLSRVLEPEVMDTAEDVAEYDAMDHAAVNRAFVTDFLASAAPALDFAAGVGPPVRLLDVGTGTGLIALELLRRAPHLRVTAVDAAETMLAAARRNAAEAYRTGRVVFQFARAQALPYPDLEFTAVVSNSLIHHVPDPAPVFAEMVRVCDVGGAVFVRDLLRPDTESELARLVSLYAGDATDYQRKLFADSLRAALTVDEVRDIVGALGYAADTVTVTSDRHWTWAVRRA